MDRLYGGEHEVFNLVTRTEVIRCTSEHKFAIDGRGWTKAFDLEVGDMFTSLVSGRLSLDECESSEYFDIQPTYNLQVEPFHNYFVGESRILVRNVIRLDK